uniref:ARAD1C33264p n=1 Tax=Blastobotrys adeninivorans TaxID=409370 RepID=A0A060T3G7_BLAAD
MSLATSLSPGDQKVLAAILSGEGPGVVPGVKVDSSLSPDAHITDVDELSDLVAREKRAIKLVEESEDYRAAMEILNEIISHQPLYASAYNNRAQLARLYESGMSQDGIIEDLEKAIDLAKPEKQTDAVSKMRATVLCQAYSQLGGLYIQESKRASDSWPLEERASECLHFAGLYGNELARAVATQVNPYAKLCGNMVSEALRREREQAA